MKTRICTSTLKATGCDKPFPLDDKHFRKVKKNPDYYDTVCIKCRNKSRRTTKGIIITPEIFKQYDNLIRGRN